MIAVYAPDMAVLTLTEDTDIAQDSDAGPEPIRAPEAAGSPRDTAENSRLTTDTDRVPSVRLLRTQATTQRSANIFRNTSTVSSSPLSISDQSDLQSRYRAFNTWFYAQDYATRRLIAYSDFQYYYIIYGSRPPDSMFTRLPHRTISNTLLFISIWRNKTEFGSSKMESGHCRTLYDFVDTLTAAVEKLGIGDGPEWETPKWEGARLVIDRGEPRGITEAEILRIVIGHEGVERYDEWWRASCGFTRGASLMLGRLHLEE